MIDISTILMVLNDEEDRERCAQIYERYKQMMYAIVSNILHEEKDIEDCFGETFLYIIEHWDEYSQKSPIHQFYFLKKCCTNRAFNMAKRRKMRCKKEVSNYDYETGELIDIPDDAPSAQDLLITKENIALMEKLFSELPTADQDLLYILNTTALTHEEVGEMFGMSKGAVGSRVSRIRKRLDKKWKENV